MNMWSKINASLTEMERSDFNDWKERLYLIADSIRDHSRLSSASYAFADDANTLMELINQIPLLKGNQ